MILAKHIKIAWMEQNFLLFINNFSKVNPSQKYYKSFIQKMTAFSINFAAKLL